MARTIALVFLVLLQLNLPARAETVESEIAYLLDYIGHSTCIFIRNGSDYDGAAAADHIEKKYDHFKDEIHSAEDFIDRAATKSELSGQPYRIRCSDGSTVLAADWIRAALQAHRNAAPSGN